MGPAPAPAGRLGREPQWLEVDPAIMLRARRGVLPLLLAIVAVAAGFTFLYHDTIVEDPALLAQLGLILVVLAAGILYRPKGAAKPPPRFRGLRVGASERGLHYELPRGMAFLAGKPASGVAPWKQVYFDGRRLLANGTSIPVKEPIFGEIFEPARFAALVAANIPERNRLTPAQLGRRALRGQGLLAWILLALVVLAVLLWFTPAASL